MTVKVRFDTTLARLYSRFTQASVLKLMSHWWVFDLMFNLLVTETVVSTSFTRSSSHCPEQCIWVCIWDLLRCELALRCTCSVLSSPRLCCDMQYRDRLISVIWPCLFSLSSWFAFLFFWSHIFFFDFLWRCTFVSLTVGECSRG